MAAPFGGWGAPPLHPAHDKLVIISTLVHPPTLAIAEEGAIGTWLFLCHPRVVTIQLELGIPRLPEVIVVDITLVIVTTDA